jgi:uncharacterized integral membrane protein
MHRTRTEPRSESTQPPNTDTTPRVEHVGQPAQTPPVPSMPVPSQRVPRTRTGSAWAALITAALIAILLIIFLVQNTRRTEISFLWMTTTTPLAVALLIAAVGSVLLTLVIGTARITQLRRLVRKPRDSAD